MRSSLKKSKKSRILLHRHKNLRKEIRQKLNYNSLKKKSKAMKNCRLFKK